MDGAVSFEITKRRDPVRGEMSGTFEYEISRWSYGSSHQESMVLQPYQVFNSMIEAADFCADF